MRFSRSSRSSASGQQQRGPHAASFERPAQDHIKLRCRFVPDLVVKLNPGRRRDLRPVARGRARPRRHACRAARAQRGARVAPLDGAAASDCTNCGAESAWHTCCQLPKGVPFIYSATKRTATKLGVKRRRQRPHSSPLVSPLATPERSATNSRNSKHKRPRSSLIIDQHLVSLFSPSVSVLLFLVLFILYPTTRNPIEALGQRQAHGNPSSSSHHHHHQRPLTIWTNERHVDLASRPVQLVPNDPDQQRQLQPLELIDDPLDERAANQELQALASGEQQSLLVIAANRPAGSLTPANSALPFAPATTRGHQNEQQDNLLHGSNAPLNHQSNGTSHSYHQFYQFPLNPNRNQIYQRPHSLKQEALNSGRAKVATTTTTTTTRTNDKVDERREDVLGAGRRPRGEHDSAAGLGGSQQFAAGHVSVGARLPPAGQRQPQPGRPSTAPSAKQTALSNSAIAAHRMAELSSFGQSAALPVAVAFSSASKPLAQSGAAIVEQLSARTAAAAAPPASFQPAMSGESHWIPIVTNNNNNNDDDGNANRRNNRINGPVDTPSASLKPPAAAHGHGPVAQAAPPTQAASNQASSALLDFPPPPPLVSAVSHRQPKARQQLGQSAPDGVNQSRAAAALPRGPGEGGGRGAREPQLASGSHVHGQRHWHAAPSHYNQPHHHHHHHQQHQAHGGHQHRWRHQRHHNQQHQNSYNQRRPRLNSHHQAESISMNSVEPEGLEFRPNKLYKRVLLCDKTLVSLDYIRTLEAEPRPSGGQFLSEHEIAEIGDNLISDFEGTYEVLAARSSDAGASAANVTNDTQMAAPNRRQQQQQQGQLGRNETRRTSGGESLEGGESKAATLMALGGDRRIYHHHPQHYPLLSDDDPLVRCDMWDLEKGLKSRKPPAAILRQAMKADFDTVRDAINRCRQLSERTLPPDDEYRDGLDLMSTEDLVSLFSMKRGLIPGTKWCGLGDQANSYNDLGPKHRIDICCRAHDHCPIRSKPFRNDYGVLNIGLYTKSHCDCDADFYRCLREVRSRTADMLGNLYFNVMKLQCMREERLKVCREMRPIALGFERCIRYEDSPIERVFKFTTPPVAY